jgi:hypothetical protein
MDKIKFKIEGLSPLMMNSSRKADALNPLVKKMKVINEKTAKKKTEADYAMLSRLEWEAGIYCNEEGPYIPGEMIEAMIKFAARSRRMGKDIERGLQVTEDTHPLKYRGPRTIEAMWESGNFLDYRPVKMPSTGSIVMRSRAIFNPWETEFSVIFDENIVERKDIISFVNYGGHMNCLGDYRPRYGKFEATVLN